MHQTCRTCGVEKDVSEFEWRNDNKKYRSDCKECRALREVARRYNTTVENIKALGDSQEWKCGICNIHLDDIQHKSFRNKLVVDHCHTTGKIRGLLCPTCNCGLGHFADSQILLALAIRYLSK